MAEFRKGARVTYSMYGVVQLHPKKPQRMGTVVTDRQRGNPCVSVQWDDRRYPQTLHESFLLEVSSGRNT